MFGSDFRGYWPGARGAQEIEDLLNSPECTVEKLMDEEEFSNELRNSNARLLQFFDARRLNSLLDYIVVEPPAGADDKRSYKYPFYASEVFTCDVKDIIDLFFVESKPAEPKLASPKKDEPDSQSGQSAKPEAAPPAKKEETAKEQTAPVTVPTPVPAPAAQSEKPKEEVKKESESKPNLEQKPEMKTEVKTETKKEEPVPETKKEMKKEAEKPVVEAKKEEVAKAPEEVKKEEEKKLEVLPEKADVQSPMDTGEDVLLESPHEEKKTKEAIVRYWLLEKLLSLLSAKGEVNSVLAGYFAKVIQAIMEKRRQDFLEYIFKYEEHMDGIIKHSYNKSIAEVLSRIVSNEDRFNSGSSADEFGMEKVKVLAKMVGKMSPANSPDDITNNCYILCTLADSRQQLKYFLSEPVLTQMFTFAKSTNPMAIRAALTFFVILYRLKSSPQATDPAPAFLGFSRPEPETKQEEELDFALLNKLSTDYLPFSKSYLEAPNTTTKLETQFGDTVVPFGLDRLKVVEWLQALLLLKDEAICAKVSELGIPRLLLSLMKKYDMNSVLHLKVFRLFDEVLSSEIESYIESFTIKCDLAGGVLDFQKEGMARAYKSTGKQFCKAYMAFVSKFAEKLTSLSAGNQAVDKYLKGNPEWEKFRNGELRERLAKENKQLGGPEKEPSLDEDHDEPDLSSHDKFSSHRGQPEGKEEVAEENLFASEGDAAVKVNIVPQDEDKKVEFEEVEEKVVNTEVDKKQAEAEIENKLGGIQFEEAVEKVMAPEMEGHDILENETAETRTAGTKQGIQFDEVEEKLVEPAQGKEQKPETAAVPVPVPIPAPAKKPEEEVHPRISEPVPVEAPLATEYASNNYWRDQTGGMKLEDLEKENPF